MTPERYSCIRELFLTAREQNPSQRAEFLSQACSDDDALREEVESLLANDAQAKTFMQTPVLGESFAMSKPESLAASLLSESPVSSYESPKSSPQYIGQYRILDVLGQGGMGIVYRAEQDNPRRIVALKVIKPGVESRETLKRFEHEGQVLGWLQDPGIAQVFEAGSAATEQGLQPFFAMEFIQGKPLTDYAYKQRLGIRERLELIAKICDAVHHAHQKGVIHRDLKPGNILVNNSGQPKILDFGVSRVIGADIQTVTLQTTAGQLLGTIAYMSPEQITSNPHKLDKRSDVYSLGVILYELMTGRVPIDVSNKGLPQAARAIVEEEPEPLHMVNRAYRGDVETIVTKALEKDKGRRYQSAADLAADIRRYLSDEPIAARPVTTLYQLRKFARRNKALVGGILVAFVALLIGFIGTASQATRATHERNRAREAERLAGERLLQTQAEARKVTAINKFFNDMLTRVNPTKDGRDVRMVDVLDRAAENLSVEFSDQPEIEASLQNTVGTVYVGLGLYAEAEAYLRSAVAIRSELLGKDHPDTLAGMTNLAAVLKGMGQWPQAEELLRETLEVRQRELGREHTRTLDSMNNLADVMQQQGKIAEAELLWRQTLTLQRRVLKRDDPALLITMNNLAQLLKQLRRPDEAEPLLREALALMTESLGLEHPHTLSAMSNLSTTLRAQGKYAEAEQLLHQVIDIRRRTLSEHPSIYSAINNLAGLLQDQDRLREAEPLTREALEGLRRTLGTEHPSTLLLLNNLATLQVELGRAQDAEVLYTELLETAQQTLTEDHWMTLVFKRNYGKCLTALHQYERAEALLLHSYEGLKQTLSAEHEHTHKTLKIIVELYEAWGKSDQAAEYRAKLE